MQINGYKYYRNRYVYFPIFSKQSEKNQLKILHKSLRFRGNCYTRIVLTKENNERDVWIRDGPKRHRRVVGNYC